MRRSLHRPVLSVLALVLAAGLAGPSAAEEEAKPERINLTEGMTFPTFEGTTWKDEAFDFGDHLNQGKYILVDFWAAWCGPCMAEMPHMTKVMNEFQNAQFEIVTISLDNEGSKERLDKAVADHGLTFPIITDWQQWKSRYVAEYGVYGIPANFLLGPDGTILMRDLRGEKLEMIAEKFANTPNLDYKPITLNLTVGNMPERPTPEAPETPVEDLTLTLEVSNPQAGDGAISAGVTLKAYVRTGQVTLKKNTDGTYYTKKGEATPAIFQVAEKIEEVYEVEVSSGDGNMRPTIMVPIPEGTMDAELTPFTYSQALDLDIEGKGAYPSWSAEYWMDAEDIEKQGGIIDPATATVEAAVEDTATAAVG